LGPQLIWLGLLGLELAVTVPFPVKSLVLVTVRGKVCSVSVALTDFAALSVTIQVGPDVVSHPLQLVKLDPVAGAAIRVTTVPLS